MISGQETVGPGVEFLGSALSLTYELDLGADYLELTVSKPTASGNFAAFFQSLSLSEIDDTLTNVTFDAANSGLFDAGDQPDINFTPNELVLSSPGPFSTAIPPSALSISYRWNLEFASVPEPSCLPMVAGLIAFATGLRRRS